MSDFFIILPSSLAVQFIYFLVDSLNYLVVQPEAGSRKSEVGSLRSDVRSRKSKVGSPKSGVGSPFLATVETPRLYTNFLPLMNQATVLPSPFPDHHALLTFFPCQKDAWN